MGMATVTVSGKGQVVIPAEIRQTLGILPGMQLEFRIEGHGLRAEVLHKRTPSRLEDGIAMLRPTQARKGRLLDFDVADAMKRSLGSHKVNSTD